MTLRQPMEQGQLLYLSRSEVASLGLDIPTAIGILEQAFKEKAAGRVEMPAKLGIYPRQDAFSHAMPAHIPALRAAGMKWVSSYAGNNRHDLPNINGLIILNDPDTGIPYAVMDCTWITGRRTGAATALAARYLARPDSRSAGILACGVQGRSNLEALASLFPIQRVYAYDISPQAAQSYAEEMSRKLGVVIIPVKMPRQAVVDSDLVVTSGPIQKHPTPCIEKNWLKPGSFASSVDYGSYWKAEALFQIEKLCTDDMAQYRYNRENGYFEGTPIPYADLGEIVSGQKPGREREDERTMAMNLGLALDDIAIAREIYRRAKEKGVGTWLPR
jgi:ornithine cyclodeaminase/alanine dehydrogenase-like protein (mu-crystallin family)